MKYYTRLNLYKASNVKFNPETLEATSFDWWVFVKKFGDIIVFNNYNYSNSTNKHQSKVRSLLQALELYDYLVVETSESLDRSGALESVIENYENQIKELESKIAAPRTQKKKNEDRKNEIKKLRSKILKVKEILEK